MDEKDPKEEWERSSESNGELHKTLSQQKYLLGNKMEKVSPPKELKPMWTFIYSFTFSLVYSFTQHVLLLCAICTLLHIHKEKTN